MEAVNMLPIAQAATMVGRTRMALMKAIEKGKITAIKDIHGRWQIDPAELTRVYRVLPVANSNQMGKDALGSIAIEKLQADLQAEKTINSMLREQVDDLKQQREQERAERIQAQAQVNALLQQTAASKSGLWAKLFSK